jgi:hypothetical protein
MLQKIAKYIGVSIYYAIEHTPPLPGFSFQHSHATLTRSPDAALQQQHSHYINTLNTYYHILGLHEITVTLNVS